MPDSPDYERLPGLCDNAFCATPGADCSLEEIFRKGPPEQIRIATNPKTGYCRNCPHKEELESRYPKMAREVRKSTALHDTLFNPPEDPDAPKLN